MRFFPNLSDRDADAIVAGSDPAGDGELQELARFFRQARDVLAESPSAATAAAHLAAIAEAARVSASQGADRRASVPPSRRRLRGPFALPVRLVAAAAGLVLVAAFGGVAYAGGLPDPVQGKVADLVSNVGISLPGNHNDVDQGDVVNVDPGKKGGTDHANQGSTTETNPANHVVDPQPKTDAPAHPKTTDGVHTNTDDGTHTKTNHIAPSQTDHGAPTETDDHAQPPTDPGAHTKTVDATQPTTDDGVHTTTTTDDGAHSDPDDGAHGNGNGKHG